MSYRLLVILLCSSGLSYAQGGAASSAVQIQQSNGAPSGACQPQQVDVNTAAGTIYTCQSAVWAILPASALALANTPLTTRGDLLTVNSTPALIRLALAGANLYPKSNGSDLIYSTLAAGGVGNCTNQFVRNVNADAAPTCNTVALATDVSGQLPIGNVGSAGLSGTAPATISAAGAIGCATCVTSAASLTSNVIPKGSGGAQGVANSLITDNGTTATYTGTGGYSAPVLVSSVATGTAPLTITSTTPVANLVVSKHPTEQFCGTTSTCSATAETGPKIVFGSAPLVSGTPSTVTISGISPAFTATADYVCTVTAQSGAGSALLSVANVSASSFTITGPATDTRVVNYICVGF
jgi:hypothetical protein